MFKLLSSMRSQKDEERQAHRYRELIRQEAKLGGELFGPVPKGVRREFFCLDKHTWVWHEEWNDAQGKHRFVTTRYDMRPDGILKAQDGQPYRYVSKQEGRHLLQAIRLYRDRMRAELYS